MADNLHEVDKSDKLLMNYASSQIKREGYLGGCAIWLSENDWVC